MVGDVCVWDWVSYYSNAILTHHLILLLSNNTTQREMQVAVLLAGMETQGMYVNPQVLQQHEAVVTARKEQIQKEADALSVQAGVFCAAWCCMTW